MERVKRGKEKVLGSGRYHSRHSRSWLGYGLVVLATCCLVSCTTLKKAGVTSLGAGGGAIVGSVLSGGAIAPILGATTGAFVTDVVTETMMTKKQSGTVLQTEQGMIECAPDNLWSLLGQITEMGGWFLILIFVVPMLLGWILPGPLERKKKQKNLFS
tara:strand:+ start:302 stop:775 length:474 start_codon:yes stop_codon:yes gene_type:complete